MKGLAIGACPVCGQTDVTVDRDGICADRSACAMAFARAWVAGTLLPEDAATSAVAFRATAAGQAEARLAARADRRTT